MQQVAVKCRKISLIRLMLPSICLISHLAWATVPVEDVTQNDASSTFTATSAKASSVSDAFSGANDAGVTKTSSNQASLEGLPVKQRLTTLERQMGNLTQMDILGQVANLQQQLEKLHGQIEVQQHTIEQLSEQVRTQYQDIDQRFAKLNSANTSVPTKPIVATNKIAVKKDPVETSSSAAEMASSTTSASSTPKNPSIEEQKAYEKPYQLLKKRDYVKAATAFQKFIKAYPKGFYAANAHYWLGEIYLLQQQPDLAAAEFKTIIKQFPQAQKYPDAMLKLGFAYFDKGQFQEARKQLTKVKNQFPDTTAAQLANAKLREINKHASK